MVLTLLTTGRAVPHSLAACSHLWHLTLCGRETALMKAAAKGDTRTVEVLIAAGADVAAKDSDG